ncbi:MAG: metallophosphoesterase family protein [Chloroflexota bacterium]
MTALAILSDIHGNLPALEAVLADMRSFRVDQIVVAGDVVNFGPFSKQTAEIVIERGWLTVRGNNEYFLLDYGTPRAPAEWGDSVSFAPTAWMVRQFDAGLKSRLARWPDTLNLRFDDAPPIQVFHGAPNDCWDSIFWTLTDAEIEKLLAGVEANFVVCGHTHLPMDRQAGRWRIFNPGSVGVPLDGIFSASYMLLEGNERGWTPTFRRVPFDYDAVFAEFERSGFNRECGPIGRLVVEIYKQARPAFGFLKWRDLQKPDSPITDELLDEYLAAVNWWEFADPAYRVNM